MSNYVFVLNHEKQLQTPIHPGYARQLLNHGHAAVYRRYPFVLILKKGFTLPIKPKFVQIKLDPGSKTTGIALVQANKVVWGAELSHRGFQIKDDLQTRRQLRRSRRSRKTRYRQPRFLNRKRKPGWLAPSLQHRIDTTITWVKRLMKYVEVCEISQELVKFDMQAMQNPEISGVEYQQGTLAGYELRQYLLEKWQRQCAYCGKKDCVLQIEHIVPRAKGGSNRASNLALACEKCNQAKGTQKVEDFLKKKPDVLKKILAQAKKPLKDAAAVNTTRWALFDALKSQGLAVWTGTGGQTQFNRVGIGLPKAHWIDAACVGILPEINGTKLQVLTSKPLLIAAKGHGTRQSCRTNKFGFPNRHVAKAKTHFGFSTGDIVKAVVPTGKKKGIHVGRLAARASGSFNISTTSGLIQAISHKYCKTIHKKDGYAYE
jgi:5-methylcytosine-specific restriction endonuclease McrA